MATPNFIDCYLKVGVQSLNSPFLHCVQRTAVKFTATNTRCVYWKHMHSHAVLLRENLSLCNILTIRARAGFIFTGNDTRRKF